MKQVKHISDDAMTKKIKRLAEDAHDLSQTFEEWVKYRVEQSKAIQIQETVQEDKFDWNAFEDFAQSKNPTKNMIADKFGLDWEKLEEIMKDATKKYMISWDMQVNGKSKISDIRKREGVA